MYYYIILSFILQQNINFEILACACLEQVPSLRSADKHTPENKTMVAKCEVCKQAFCKSSHFLRHHYALHFLILSITSRETSPISSPSSMHLKLSNNNNFLSSCPILHTTSSSNISEIKY